MAISFDAATKALLKAAAEQVNTQSRHRDPERVDIRNAVGRVSRTHCISPSATPMFDTSAMDGYAVEAALTVNASPERPAIFQVVGTIVPGDEPSITFETTSQGSHVCLEIMTGARFPDSHWPLGCLDACVKVEDVSKLISNDHSPSQYGKYVAVERPVQPMANRRKAGSDIRQFETLLATGQTITMNHLLPLASVGLQTVDVAVKPRIGIWSTGSEFVSNGCHSVDVNGPYLTAACREYGVEAAFLGHLSDEADVLCKEFSYHSQTGDYDILITSGAVSAGKYDFVRNALEQAGADIVFHGVDMRPGHPVLFAKLPTDGWPVAFFGLPGNPGAAAACFRFLVVSYLRCLQGRDIERPIIATVVETGDSTAKKVETSRVLVTARPDVDRFFVGQLRSTAVGTYVVQFNGQTSAAMLQPFISANCWVHVGAGCEIVDSALVECYT